MAYIVTGYQKTGAMLILNPRERLIYPFDVGNYNEIRWGMIFSWAPASGDNAYVPTDNYTPNSNTPIQYPFIGFCNYKTGDRLPGQSAGYDFIGGSTPPNLSPQRTVGITNDGTFIYLFWGGDTAGNGALITTCQTGFTKVVKTVQDGSYEYSMAMLPQTGVFGATKYSSFFGQRLVLSGANEFGFSTSWNYNSDCQTSDAYLRGLINSAPSNTSLWSGYFTSGGTSTTNDVMLKPNALFVYTPMLNSRLRIHNLIVERYA